MPGRKRETVNPTGTRQLYWGTGPFENVRAGAGEPAEGIACLIKAGGKAGLELSWEKAISLMPQVDHCFRLWAAEHPEQLVALLIRYVRLCRPC